MIQIAQLFEVSTSPKVAICGMAQACPHLSWHCQDLMATETYECNE